jgi:hypothetical protein
MSNSFNMSDWRRKYILMAENDNQAPKYDPTKHKTLMRGAIDYELQGDNIVAYLPFEEEAEDAVEYTFPAKQLEDYLGLGEKITDNEELQNLDSDKIDRFFHDKYSGAFGSYWKTPRGQSMRAGKTEKDPFLKPMKEAESLKEDWGSSDQSIMNQSIHKELGAPTEFPSPFNPEFESAVESAVDFYWDEWPEYTTDREGLISKAMKLYYRAYFPEKLEGFMKMFGENQHKEEKHKEAPSEKIEMLDLYERFINKK